MKIAICLSGQPRTISHTVDSILGQFSNGHMHTYDFFCHSWNYNTWKSRDQTYDDSHNIVDLSELTKEIVRFNPKQFIISDASELWLSNGHRYIQSSSLSYSMMLANHLKRMYELKNDFKYDYVVKARFDNVFKPNYYINFDNDIKERTIYYPHIGRIVWEYNKINLSDCIFYGDSWGMDIMCDFYRYLHSMPIPETVPSHIIGSGTAMYDYAVKYNIQPKLDRSIHEILFRKEAIGLNPAVDFEEISNIHASYY